MNKTASIIVHVIILLNFIPSFAQSDNDRIIILRQLLNSPTSFEGLVKSTSAGAYQINDISASYLSDQPIPYTYAYGSPVAYGTASSPSGPYCKAYATITTSGIMIKQIDNDIFVHASWNSKGRYVRPKDPFTEIWNCKTGQKNISSYIELGNSVKIPVTISYTCKHSSKTISRGSSFRMGGKAQVDYYPPENFNHEKTVVLNFNKAAQYLGISVRELAVLMAYHGVYELHDWSLTNKESQALTYILCKIFKLSINDLIDGKQTLEKKNDSNFRRIEQEAKLIIDNRHCYAENLAVYNNISRAYENIIMLDNKKRLLGIKGYYNIRAYAVFANYIKDRNTQKLIDCCKEDIRLYRDGSITAKTYIFSYLSRIADFMWEYDPRTATYFVFEAMNMLSPDKDISEDTFFLSFYSIKTETPWMFEESIEKAIDTHLKQCRRNVSQTANARKAFNLVKCMIRFPQLFNWENDYKTKASEIFAYYYLEKLSGYYDKTTRPLLREHGVDDIDYIKYWDGLQSICSMGALGTNECSILKDKLSLYEMTSLERHLYIIAKIKYEKQLKDEYDWYNDYDIIAKCQYFRKKNYSRFQYLLK